MYTRSGVQEVIKFNCDTRNILC